MKRAAKRERGAVAVTLRSELAAAIAGPVLALCYCRAAQRDETNGYRHAAAMEWRKAALLLAVIPAAADRCWQHWEHLMNLPRHLARPIS